jgi:hypothetical protein
MTGRSQSNAPTILALLGLLGVAAGLLGLSALVLPQVFGLLAVVLGFFAFGAIHYLLWGWWLRPLPVEDEVEPADVPTDEEP